MTTGEKKALQKALKVLELESITPFSSVYSAGISLDQASREILESKYPGSTLGKTRKEIQYMIFAENLGNDFVIALKNFARMILMNSGADKQTIDDFLGERKTWLN